MEGKLRNMTSIYITSADRILLLLRQGGRVVNNVWVGSAGGHFEEFELNDARACVLRELKEELGLTDSEKICRCDMLLCEGQRERSDKIIIFLQN